MKQLILVFAIGLLFSSCKRNFTCVCSVNVVTSGITTSASSSTTYHDTKSGATASCNNNNTNVSFGNTSTSTSCSIK